MKIEGSINLFKDIQIGELFEISSVLFLKIKNEHIEAGKNLEIVYNLNAIDLTKNQIVSIDDEQKVLKRNGKIVLE
jgi:hypothetical protein